MTPEHSPGTGTPTVRTLTCPGCGAALGLFAFMQAATPWHLRCGSCGLKLRQDRLRVSAVLVAGGVGLVLGAIGTYVAIAQNSLFTGPLLFIAGLVLFEVLAFKLLPRLGVGLERRGE